jgi:hypothetical protein
MLGEKDIVSTCIIFALKKIIPYFNLFPTIDSQFVYYFCSCVSITIRTFFKTCLLFITRNSS